MSNQFLNNHKLATLSELRYLLLEVLDRKDPISWYDLSFSCKELSFNFAFSFENSIDFLKLISLINIHTDRSVSRVTEEFNSTFSDHELGLFILKKTVAYLETNKLLDQVFNDKTIVTENISDMVLICVNEIPGNFLFIQSLLMNLGIVAGGDKNETGKLPVAEAYKDYFLKLQPKTMRINPVAPTSTPMLFISYAIKDKEFKNELQNHLSGLKMNKLIRDWEGRAILPGQDWEEEIRQKLEQAEVVLFLVSSDFMASEYIHDVEIKKTIERQRQGLVKIIPIIVRPCDYNSLPILRYQALPDEAKAISLWPNRDEAYVNIVNGIKKVIKQMSNTN